VAADTVTAEELRFGAMGSDAHVIVVGGPAGAAARARDRIAELEARWSRFRDDSEISELNRRAGSAVPVSDDTVALVRRAVEAWWMTGGRYDPTLLGDVLRAGYDRSFAELAATGDRAASTSTLRAGCPDIEVDPVPGTVRLAAGTGFDPGGIGKGLAADLVTAELLACGAEGVLVNVGGDLRVAGGDVGGTPWTIGIEHPFRSQPVALVGLRGGAVATSTTLKRRWEVDGERRHHLIDPRTGRPSTSDLELVAVVAGEAWRSEVMAKAVLLRGAHRGFELLAGTGMVALAVDTAGWVLASPGLEDFLGDATLPARIERSAAADGALPGGDRP
jgi:thiamine biosynthesis lipoprotein